MNEPGASSGAFPVTMTRAVLIHRQRLLTAYFPHDLHQLRVHIRRIRVLMKQVPALHCPSLRAAWRSLFAETGPARDWDVLMHTAFSLLPETHARALSSTLRAGLQSRRQQALAMLTSADWHRHLRAWTGLLDTVPDEGIEVPGSRLSAAIARARAAEHQAQTTNGCGDWHRFRIALKNVRYLASFQRLATPEETGLAVLEQRCSEAQELLGEWHDGSIQGGILDSDEVRTLVGLQTEASQAAVDLARSIEQRRAQNMARMRALPPLFA